MGIGVERIKHTFQSEQKVPAGPDCESGSMHAACGD